MTQSEKRVLPADAFDALELSVLINGGIGPERSFTDADRFCPCCILGHAEFAVDVPFAEGTIFGDWPKNTIADALQSIGVWGSQNDNAIRDINRRKKAPYETRVSFVEFTRELDIVRGE